MADRLVKQIFPALPESELNKQYLFSNYLTTPNIILLGDPGAGKTSLFRHFADTPNGQYLTVRKFLIAPSAVNSENLFIDGLDEKRSSRTDKTTIDELARYLYRTKAKYIRISCRVADWLGATDLEAFKAIGDYVVLKLELLTPIEQAAILSAQGRADPHAFIKHAHNLGLNHLLVNPQNLVMLSQVVQKNEGWPTTRAELFEKTIDILLSEHNEQHLPSDLGKYHKCELNNTAGAVCAIGLISDAAGISLSAQNDNLNDFPCYRTLAPICVELEKVQAVLSRRIFMADAIEGAVTYTHRTIAEYLGAQWLTKQISHKGLSLGRVRALLGIDGPPASELRGLHAWLAVFLPENDASLLIEADPYGVLTYGDVTSFTPAKRQKLLTALMRLSETDPWFYYHNDAAQNLGALSNHDMIPAFSEILRSSNTNFSLKLLVLSTLANGIPLLPLQPELLAILVEQAIHYELRTQALDALLKMDSEVRDVIAKIYRTQLGSSAETLQLKAEILVELYHTHFEPNDVVNLLLDTFHCRDRLTIGAFWLIHKCLSSEDMFLILDNLRLNEQFIPGQIEFPNRQLVLSVFDQLLLHLLIHTQLSGIDVWRWLLFRHALNANQGIRASDELKNELASHTVLLQKILEAAIDTLTVDKQKYYFIYQEIFEITFAVITENQLLQYLAQRILQAKDTADKLNFLYQVSFNFLYRLAPDSYPIFEKLYNFGLDHPTLSETRASCCFNPIDSLQQEYLRNKNQRVKQEAENKIKRLQTFDQQKDLIRSGLELGWLAIIAEMYFPNYRDKSKEFPAYSTLVQELGEERAQLALEGLVACLQRENIPLADEVAQASINNSYPRWWLAIIAGLNERWIQQPDLRILPKELIATALAIDLVYPMYFYENHTPQQISYIWKLAILKQSPTVVNKIYYTIVESQFRSNSLSSTALNELLTNSALIPFRADNILALLREFPNAVLSHLKQLFSIILESPQHYIELLTIIRKTLAEKLIQDRYELWLIVAYLISPEAFTVQIKDAANANIIWSLRDIIDYTNMALNPMHTAEIIHMVAQHYPNTDRPSGVQTGNTNPWDAAEFVYRLLARLSADSSIVATKALEYLLTIDALATYRDTIKHKLANQRTKRRADDYERPTWDKTISALLNGKPANIEDLYALVISHLEDIKQRIKSTNTNLYKRFWNEKGNGQITSAKPEESCRDVVLDLLNISLQPLGIVVLPEGRVAAKRSVDIIAQIDNHAVMIEFKRDYHHEVWVAIENQLTRFYTSDYRAKGYGILGVFWFGEKRGENKIPKPPSGEELPKSAAEMQRMLASAIPFNMRHQVTVIVFDVSEPNTGC